MVRSFIGYFCLLASFILCPSLCIVAPFSTCVLYAQKYRTDPDNNTTWLDSLSELWRMPTNIRAAAIIDVSLNFVIFKFHSFGCGCYLWFVIVVIAHFSRLDIQIEWVTTSDTVFSVSTVCCVLHRSVFVMALSIRQFDIVKHDFNAMMFCAVIFVFSALHCQM